MGLSLLWSEYVLPEELAERLSAQVKVVVLPSCCALPDVAVEALRRFVARGGKLLADRLPATCDEHGKQRDGDSPLAAVFNTPAAICLGRSATDKDATELDSALKRLSVRSRYPWRTAAGKLPRQLRLYGFQLGAVRYLGIIRRPAGDDDPDQRIAFDLPRPTFVYNCLTGTYLGRLRTAMVSVPPGEAAVLALLPYRVSRLPAKAQFTDKQLVVTMTLLAERGASPAEHVVHLTVTPPGWKRPADWYTRDVVVHSGTATIRLPLALNDPAGTWTVTVRDVATGIESRVKVEKPGD